MDSSGNKNQNAEDSAQQAAAMLERVDLTALSFIQLRRLNAALIDASEQLAAEAERRSNDDVQGDTVRVALPQSSDR